MFSKIAINNGEMANWQLDVFEKINVIHGSKPTFWLKLLTNSVDKLGYKTVNAN